MGSSEFLKRFALASAATAILSSCNTMGVYGPGPGGFPEPPIEDSTKVQDSSDIQDTSVVDSLNPPENGK